MEHISWTSPILFTEETAEAITDALCEQLNLCASVGCACLVGKGGESKCQVGGLADTYRVALGPHWKIFVISTGETIDIEFYYEGVMYQQEWALLINCLNEQQIPLLLSRQVRV